MFWNVVIAISIALTAAGYWLQKRTVVHEKCGEAISITWLLGGIAAGLSKVVYGEDGGGLAFVASGVGNIICRSWLLGYVLKFKRIKKWEVIVIVFLSALLEIMISAPSSYISSYRLYGFGLTWKDLAMCLIGLGTFFVQKFEVKSAGSKGVFRESLPATTILSAVLLIAYCVHAKKSGPLVGYVAYIVSQVAMVRANRRAHNPKRCELDKTPA